MPTDPSDLKTTEYWRIYIGLPLISGLIAAFLFSLTFKTESPQYLILKKKDENAIASIKKIYHSSEDPHEILEYMKAKMSKHTESMTLKEALCDRRYYMGMLVLAVNTLSQSFNGGIVIVYGQVMLGRIFGHSKEGDKNVNMILNIMAAIGPISLIFSIFTTRAKSRKLILMLYAFSIGLMNVGFAVSDLLHLAWTASIFSLGIMVSNSLLGFPILVVY